MNLNQVYCVDCLVGLQTMKVDGILADLIITDPPYYIVNLQKNLKNESLRGSSKNNIFFDEFDHFQSLEEYQTFIKQMLSCMKAVMQPKAQAYMFFSYHHIDWGIKMIKDMGFRYYKPLIWYKPDTMGVFPNQYGCNYEVILWFRNDEPGGRVKLHIGCSQRDVFKVCSTNINYRKECGFHPTPKPVGIIRKLISNGSDSGDLILDPFMGSGTTAVASKQIGRRFVGFENNPDYFSICQRRLAQTPLVSFFEKTMEEKEDEQTERENSGSYGWKGEDALAGTLSGPGNGKQSGTEGCVKHIREEG